MILFLGKVIDMYLVGCRDSHLIVQTLTLQKSLINWLQTDL